VGVSVCSGGLGLLTGGSGVVGGVGVVSPPQLSSK
jgi:hypothetical protein